MKMFAKIELNYYDGPTELIACTYTEHETLDGRKYQLPTWYYGAWRDDEGEYRDDIRIYHFWPLGPAPDEPEFKIVEWDLEWTEFEGARGARYQAWAERKRAERDQTS